MPRRYIYSARFQKNTKPFRKPFIVFLPITSATPVASSHSHLDEAYLDVSDNRAQLPSATATAEEIRRRVREELQLTISAGVSCNKLIAKLASDENKPDGICVVPPAKINAFLTGRPCASCLESAQRLANACARRDLLPSMISLQLVQNFGNKFWVIKPSATSASPAH